MKRVHKLLFIAILLVSFIFLFNTSTQTTTSNYFSVADMSNMGSLDDAYRQTINDKTRVADYFNMVSPSEFGVQKKVK